MDTISPSSAHLLAPGNAPPAKAASAPQKPTRYSPLPNRFLLFKVQDAFSADPALKNAPIVIDVLDGVVYLTGIVKSRIQQTIAIYVAGQVKGVHGISNRIRIVRPTRQGR